MTPPRFACRNLIPLAAALAILPIALDSRPPQPEERISALLKQMTLEEKFGQLQQLDGHADGTIP